MLGLLISGPRSTYELVKQVARGLRFVWPRAEGRIYDEPKVLVAHGLAVASKERTGRRPRTVYSITPEGKRALRRWLAGPAAGPVLEYETLLKISFAAHGTRADLLRHLSAVAEQAEANMATGRTRADEYVNARVPMPDNIAINALMWNFLWQFYSAVGGWARWAAAEVSGWPDDLRPTAGTQDWAIALLRTGLAEAEPRGPILEGARPPSGGRHEQKELS